MDSQQNKVTANKAYSRGLWRVRIWPMVIVLVAFGGLLYAVLQVGIALEYALIAFGAVLLICFIWSLRNIGKWKTWMAENSGNPKTSLELAKASFLKYSLKENLAIWSKNEKLKYRSAFDKRMDEVRKEYLTDAENRYSNKQPVIVHYKFSGLLWMLLFEIAVIAGLVILFMQQDDTGLKAVFGGLALIGFVGFIYTIKTIWKRNVKVIEITVHGITILEEHFGWIELETIDVVRGNTLIYKRHKGEQKELNTSNLSLSGNYLDELILFYRTVKTSETE